MWVQWEVKAGENSWDEQGRSGVRELDLEFKMSGQESSLVLWCNREERAQDSMSLK